jgi:hypothetical protein
MDGLGLRIAKLFIEFKKTRLEAFLVNWYRVIYKDVIHCSCHKSDQLKTNN